MSYFDKDFFSQLRELARHDLSRAHLYQHFTVAQQFLSLAGITKTGQGTWSSLKPNDSVTYSHGTLSGKKHWISGLPRCEWAVIAVTYNDRCSVVMFETKHINPEPVATTGMENTLTAHVCFDMTPAVVLFDRQDPVCGPANSFQNLSFLTIQLGIMESLFKDIDSYTKNKFDYEKKKLRTDVEIMHLLWQQQVETADEFNANNFKTRDLIYAFGKKTLTAVVNFVTEVTGSGIYEIDHPAHQRYKDALIYSTHMKNVSAAVDFVFGDTVSDK